MTGSFIKLWTCKLLYLNETFGLLDFWVFERFCWMEEVEFKKAEFMM